MIWCWLLVPVGLLGLRASDTADLVRLSPHHYEGLTWMALYGEKGLGGIRGQKSDWFETGSTTGTQTTTGPTHSSTPPHTL